MADDEVVNQEIKHPIEHEVSTTASGIAEQLLRDPFLKRPMEKINYFRYYLREFIHIDCKVTAFLANMQIFQTFFEHIGFIYILC